MTDHIPPGTKPTGTSKEVSECSRKRFIELLDAFMEVTRATPNWSDGIANRRNAVIREFDRASGVAPETCDVQQLRDARYCIGVLLQVAGGRVIIKPSDMINFDSKKEVLTFDDPVSGCRIMELRPPQKAFVQLCAPHGKDWLTCPECAKAAGIGGEQL